MVCGMRIEAYAIENKYILRVSEGLISQHLLISPDIYIRDGIRWQDLMKWWQSGTWQELTNLCLPFLPEHIEWDSVTRLVITYSEFQDTPGTWNIIVVTTDGPKGDGIHLPNTEIQERIPIGREQEDEFRTQIHDFLSGRIAQTDCPTYLGRLQILEPIFFTGQ